RQLEDVGDPPGGAWAVNARIRVGEVHDIQQVERLGAELCPHCVVHHEVLDYRQVQLRERRTDQLVALDVSERAPFRATPGTQRLSVGGQRRHTSVRGQ